MWSWIRKLWQKEELPPRRAEPSRTSVIRFDEHRAALELGFEKVLREEFPMLGQLQRDVAIRRAMQSIVSDALLGWDKWTEGKERLRVIASRMVEGIDVDSRGRFFYMAPGED